MELVSSVESNSLMTDPYIKENMPLTIYSSKSPTTLLSLRWELFRSKNLEGEMLPPTRAALLPHVLHANYVAMRHKAYLTNFLELPLIEVNG